MRQRIIYILKHNAFLQKAYRITMSLIFRLLGMIIPTRDNEILFVSFMGKSFNDSPKVIYDYIQNEKDLKRYKCIWAFENPNHFSDLTTVKIDTPSYFIAALRAKYWITNTNIERGLRFKKKDQIYLNTWHGTTLKHIGNDVAGRNDFDFSTVDYLVVSGKYDEKIWKSAFNASERTYLRCGLPRNEELWYADENVKKKIRKKLNIPTDKKVILYAPTWRESTDGGKSYEINPPIHFEKWEELLGKDYIVLFRAHHLTTKVLGIKYNDFVRKFSDYPYVNDLMIASDYLITDYSAIAFDYSILCKPIFCYAYDYETYLNTRGTYFELDELYPNKSCRTEEELLNRIIQCDYEFECNNTMRFRNLFIQYGYGSTEKIISKLFKCEKKEK